MNYDFLIDLGIYLLLGIGSILLMYDDIDLIVSRFRLRHRLKSLKTSEKALPKPLDYINKLLDASFEKSFGRRMFLATEILLFIIAFMLSYRNFGLSTALLVSIISIALPLLLLAANLESSRAKASKEGISLVSELYRQYRINNLNIYEAIEKTIDAGGDYALSSKRLYILLIRLRSSCGFFEVKDAIDKFEFSFGTSWAKMLGRCIRLSVDSGQDISAGLADIASQLKDAYSIEERRRMLNSEASRMTLLLVPLMYIGCFATAVFYLEIPVQDLINNQFFNPTGFLIFILTVFLFLINLLLLNIVSSGKLDY